MARNMSFFLTTGQMYAQTKTVTRRFGWDFLKAGDIVNACEKCQGLGKGGKVVKIGKIRIIDVRKERLCDITTEPNGTHKEGFPEMTGDEFVDMLVNHYKGVTPDSLVNRIEFEFVNK